MTFKTIRSPQAPEAIGPYSPGVQCGQTVYFSGQIALDPTSGALVIGGIEAEFEQVLRNLTALCEAAGGGLSNIVKLTVYLTQLSHFPLVNTLMREAFSEPYPARVTVEVSALPKQALVEVDAIMMLPQ